VYVRCEIYGSEFPDFEKAEIDKEEFFRRTVFYQQVDLLQERIHNTECLSVENKKKICYYIKELNSISSIRNEFIHGRIFLNPETQKFEHLGMTKKHKLVSHPGFTVTEMETHALRVYQIAEKIWEEFGQGAFGQDAREA